MEEKIKIIVNELNSTATKLLELLTYSKEIDEITKIQENMIQRQKAMIAEVKEMNQQLHFIRLQQLAIQSFPRLTA